MVKLEINELDATIQAKGSFAEISAKTMFLVDEFYSHIKRKDKERAEAFRAMVLEWAKGNFDD